MEFKDTLLMPKTEFEMRGNLPNKEPLLVTKWQEIDLYTLMNLNRKDAKEFILHDGPPYANGDIHCGHMRNRILKDIIIRSKNMEGYKTPFVLGWDTHGLPIENRVIKSGVNRKTTPIVEFRKKCEEYALSQVERQKEEMLRLGIVGDCKNPYITLTKDYEAQEIKIFGDMALKGLIYKGLKPVYWSPSSESALAEAEIEYHDVTSTSIYVAFKVKDGKGKLPLDSSVIIWTTTPWTIPANLAISAHPDFIYALYETNKGKFVILEEFENKLKEELNFEYMNKIASFKGSELEYVVCKHPLFDKDSLMLNGTHVTNEAGTGFVHTAPGHGMEDYQVCLKYNIKPYCPVDSRGYMMEGSGEGIEGLFYEDANKVVLEKLEANGSLLKAVPITHSYPHDWRTSKPLIFRATPQWFCSIEPIRDQLIKAIHEVKWYPSWGETRMVNMIKDRADWCISRQRAWALPIPIIYNEDGTPIIEKEVFDHISSLFNEFGSNIWYEKEAIDLLPKGYKNAHSPNNLFTKEKDGLDVWFDSGSSWNAALINRGSSFPSDIYLEGSDQYRGWFNSSLILSVATKGVAPYKEVISHGWVLDENWEQMHKSKGNGIDPNKIANILGADILRIWAAQTDYTSDVRISENLVRQTAETYKKIRNTFKFMLGNISDFDPIKNKVEVKEKVDLYLLARLDSLIDNVIKAYDKYEFSSVLSEIVLFMSSDLSSFYLDIGKDVLYCDKKDSFRRRSFQTVIYRCAESLLALLNPIIPFTMDEVNRFMVGDRKISAQLLDFPKVENPNYQKVLEEYNMFNEIKGDVLKALEEARSNKLIGSAQEAKVYLEILDDKYSRIFDNISKDELARLFVTSETILGKHDSSKQYNKSKVAVLSHDGIRCDRCWNRGYETKEIEEGVNLCPRCREAIK